MRLEVGEVGLGMRESVESATVRFEDTDKA